MFRAAFLLSITGAILAQSADFLKPELSSTLQQQLGLTLKPRRMPVEVLVIDHAEKPAGN